jgi:5-methyltetrahydropteroyltriglutamate--homocysteine methyltransferase
MAFTAILCASQGIKNISVQSSVSLQHLPYDAKLEKNLPAEVTSRLAFATQKLEEIVAAAKAAPSVAPVPLASAVPVVGMPPSACSFQKRIASEPSQVGCLLCCAGC